MNAPHWGLQQGLLGAQQQTLAPSFNALGPNRYLSQHDFLKMLAVALLLHLTVLGVASLFRDDRVKDIPVRALSFKIGDSAAMGGAPRMVVAAPIPVPQPAVVPAPITPSKAPSPWRANTAITPPKPVIPAPKAPRQRPSDNPTPLTPLPSATTPAAPSPAAPADPSPPLAALPDPALLSQPAVAANPQRFVRENGAAPTDTGAGDSAAASAQAARTRYEQEISGWIQKHKFYPATAQGAKGRTVVRVRIDRSGNVRYYGIEESANNAALDAAAIDMIRRANPMPAVPADYPAGSLIDFLIPIVF